jgi:Effector-associated domain 1
MIVSDSLTADEITALADAFPVGPPAITLLRMAGFPASAIPAGRDLTPLDFWAGIAADLSAGIMADGRRRLLAAARRRYPASTRFADPDGSPVPPAQIRPRRVLMIGASPADRQPVRTDRESRAIREAARPGCLEVQAALGAEATDLEQLRSFRPDILHFTCHGEDGCLVFNDTYGDAHPVRAHVIADTLRHYADADGVRLSGLVLAACDGEDLAPVFTDVADVIIGHRGRLDDRCGIVFATRLYQRLNDSDELARAASEAAQLTAGVDGSCTAVITNLIILPEGT